MKFWIESNKIEEPENQYIDIDSANEFLLEARTNILSESQYINYWLVNFLFVDLIKIERQHEALTLKVLKSIKDQKNFLGLS